MPEQMEIVLIADDGERVELEEHFDRGIYQDLTRHIGKRVTIHEFDARAGYRDITGELRMVAACEYARSPTTSYIKSIELAWRAEAGAEIPAGAIVKIGNDGKVYPA